MRYFLAESETSEALSDMVSQLLSEGWQLYGPPLIGAETYCQALTIEDKKD